MRRREREAQRARDGEQGRAVSRRDMEARLPALVRIRAHIAALGEWQFTLEYAMLGAEREGERQGRVDDHQLVSVLRLRRCGTQRQPMLVCWRTMYMTGAVDVVSLSIGGGRPSCVD